MDKLQVKYDKKPIHGDLYTLSNLKVLLDDLLNEYLIETGNKRKYFYSDIKIIIGIISVIFSSICCYLSMNYKFELVKQWVGICVAGYFIVNAIAMVINYFEGEKFYYDSFHIKTRVDDIPTYIVLVYAKDKVIPTKYIKSIYDLFDETGQMDHSMFLKDIDNLFKK